MSRILVAGVGNVFLSDDGFGVEVAAALARRPVPSGVEVADYGIRGVHLAYQLLEGYDALILVDAVDISEPPGTVAVIEAGAALGGRDGSEPVAFDGHSLDPATVLATLENLGGHVGRVLVVGCQPAEIGEGMGLSDPVAAAVEVAAEAALRLSEQLLMEMEVKS